MGADIITMPHQRPSPMHPVDDQFFAGECAAENAMASTFGDPDAIYRALKIGGQCMSDAWLRGFARRLAKAIEGGGHG